MGAAEDAAGGAARAAGDVFHCSLCGRDFPSCKALYGHMRSHPEREWRGINPPPGARIPVRAPPSPAPARSGGENPPRPPSPRPALSSWSTTQRRGRKGSKRHSPFRSFRSMADVDPVVTAVYGLMWISREQVAGDLQLAQPQKAPDEKIVSGGTEPETAEARGGVLQSETGEINDETGKHGGGADDVAERRKKKGKMGEPEALQEFKPAGKSSRRYRCTACNKFFPTHQALGGHMAGHKKDKGGGGPEPDFASCGGGELPAAAPPCAEKPSIPPAARIPAPVAEHRCDKCDMAFPTGQALGGHKRKHWHGHDSSASSSSAAPPPPPPPPPRENLQRNPPIGAERCCSEAATGKGKAVPRCRAPPEHGNPSSGPSAQPQAPPRKFPEPGPPAAPAAAAVAPRPPEKGSGRRKNDAHDADRAQASSSSPPTNNSRIVLGKPHDFDLNEKPKDSGDEVGF